MKLFCISILTIFICSCNISSNKTIKGNGNIQTEERTIDPGTKIKTRGFFDVELIQGNAEAVRVVADDNLLPYIITEINDGWLEIRAADNINLKSMNNIKVYVQTQQISDVAISGSGNIIANKKFYGEEHLNVSISGSGNIRMDVNTPTVLANISGSGNIELNGETRDLTIEINGMGDFQGLNLMAENATVHISGSGNVTVYTERKLDIHISGSGDVHYKGKPEITKHIAGSGDINPF